MRDLASLLQGNPELVGELAQMLAGMGTGKDTILAHITPEEAQWLHANTNGGSINPVTGLPAFDTGDEATGSESWNDAYGPGPDDNNGGNPDETWDNMSKERDRDLDYNQGPPDNPWYENFAASPSKFIGDWAGRNAGTIGAIGGGLIGGPFGAMAGSLIGDLGFAGKGIGEAGFGALGGLAGGALGAGAGLGITGGLAGSHFGGKAGQAADVTAARGAVGTQSMAAGAQGLGDPWAFGDGQYDQFGRRIG